MTSKLRISLLAAASSVAVGLASPAFADATVECNVGAGTLSTECGIGSNASGNNATAIGNSAGATGADRHRSRQILQRDW